MSKPRSVFWKTANILLTYSNENTTFRTLLVYETLLPTIDHIAVLL